MKDTQRVVPVLGVLAVLTGCAGSGRKVTVIDATEAERVILHVPGESRVVYRAGGAEASREFTLRDGVATWRRRPPPITRDARVVPVSRIAAVEVKRREGAGLGILLGFVGGSWAGVRLVASDSPFPDLSTYVGLALGGAAGAVLGGFLGSELSGWTESYVFQPDPSAEPAPGSPAPPDDRGPP